MASKYKISIEIKGTSESAKKALTSVGGTLKGLGKIAIGAGAIAVTAVAGIGIGLIKLASDATALQGIQDAFSGIAKSAGTSQDEMLAALQRGSLGMVSQRDLMATFNEAAQLVGTTFATQLPDAFSYLGKVSAATGQDMGFMIDSLVKGIGRMSPMILDNLGIQVTLADATANAAEQFGVEADALTKTQLQTGMMNVVLEQLALNTAAMPELAGTAAQAQAAFGVALTDTKDKIGLALLPMFTRLMTTVSAFATDNLPKLVEAFEEKVVPAIETVVGWLGDNLPGAIQTASGFWTDTLQPALEGVWDFIQNSVIPIITDVVDVLTEKFGEAVDWVETNWPDIQDVIEGVMDAIEGVVETVLDAIQGFWDTYGASILSAVKTTWDSIKTTIDTVINSVKGIIEAVMLAISGDWEGAWNTIKGVIETIWEGIKTVIENAFTILKDTIIPIALDAIKNLITTAWNALKDVDIARIWEGIQQVIAIVWTALVETVIPTALTAIKTAIETAWNFLKDTLVPTIWDGIKMAIKLVWYALVNTVIPTALDAVEGLIETAWNFLKDTLIPGIWDAIVSVIETAWENVKEFVQDGIDAVVDIVEGVADRMLAAGKAIVDNIKQGIADKWGELTDWFSDKLSDLTDMLPWSEPKDARSPLSNLGKAGAGIVNNLVAGMRGAMGAMADAGQELGDALIGALEGALEEGQKLVDKLFKVGGVFGGLGKFAAKMFEEQTVDPLKKALDALNDTLKEQQDLYDDLGEEQLKAQQKLIDGFGSVQAALFIYATQREKLTQEQINGIERVQSLMIQRTGIQQDITATQEELTAAAAEYAKQQERILKLQEAQQQLGFLEQQTKLLDLIREHGLDPAAILGGLKLGVGADVGAVVDAMTRAMQAIIAKIDLEIVPQQHGGFWRRGGLAAMHGNELVVPLGSREGINALAKALEQAMASRGMGFNLYGGQSFHGVGDMPSLVEQLEAMAV